jgi:uncharacterized protein
MLAQAAQRSGFKPLVIDLWADQDTRSCAEDIQQIPSLAQGHLLPAIAYFVRQYPVSCAVYGSGFEPFLDSLRRMGSRLTVLGNRPDVFARLQDKQAFFSLLKALHITYPDVSYHKPDQGERWLIKPVYGQGGEGVRASCGSEAIEASSYWQKYQEGKPHSVLFLADGKRSQIVGFNRQWTTSLNDKDEFIFSGIINNTDLTPEKKTQISGWVAGLVPELSLKGLNSMDFIQAGDSSYVLEINPRPPASMQLYGSDLFARHIKACQGELPDYQPVQVDFTAYQVVYAQQDTKIPEGFEWPEGVVDIPIPNTTISTGLPICSMIMYGKEPQQVLEQLQKRQELITYQLERFQTHGIQRQR